VSDGLLYVLSEPGDVPLDEFHHWYDTEHAPARLRVPGVHGGHRFRAADDRLPGWLAVYPLELAALDSPAYAEARVRSPYEQTVVERLAVLDRRVYARIGDAGDPAPDACPLLLTVGLTSSDPGGLDAWYEGEHLPMLRQVPGWLRTVRYRRVEGAGPDRLAVHELAGPAVFETSQYARAVSTPWRDAVAWTIRARERRLFTHHRTLG
jgi:hypothetical protein